MRTSQRGSNLPFFGTVSFYTHAVPTISNSNDNLMVPFPALAADNLLGFGRTNPQEPLQLPNDHWRQQT